MLLLCFHYLKLVHHKLNDNDFELKYNRELLRHYVARNVSVC